MKSEILILSELSAAFFIFYFFGCLQADDEADSPKVGVGEKIIWVVRFNIFCVFLLVSVAVNPCPLFFPCELQFCEISFESSDVEWDQLQNFASFDSDEWSLPLSLSGYFFFSCLPCFNKIFFYTGTIKSGTATQFSLKILGDLVARGSFLI